MKTFIFLLSFAISAAAQKVDLSSLDKLAARAQESANVNLDKNQLGLASGMLGADPKQEKAKQLIEGLAGVFVRSFEFEKEGEYSFSDLDALRSQLRGASWSKIIEVKEKKELVEIYIHNAGKPDQGMLIIAAEPTELAVVNLVGTTDLSKIGSIGALKSLPRVQSGFDPIKPKPEPKPEPKPSQRKDDE